jgi:hypothetical protein
MKEKYRLIVLFIFMCILITESAFGQLGIRTGFKLGHNWATLSDIDMNDTETLKGITGGIALELNLFNLLAVQGELLYSPQGISVKDIGDININYLSIPVLLKYKMFPVAIHPYLIAGPDLSFLLSAKDADKEDIKDAIKSQDIAIIIGGGLELSLFGKAAYIEGRYSMGMQDINEDINFTSSKNKIWQVYIGVFL